MKPDKGTGSVEENGVDDGENDLRDTEAIEVHGTPVVAVGIDVADHLDSSKVK